MAGGYEFQPPYQQMLAAELRKLQNQIDALRAALAGLGIQIDPNGNLIFDGSRGDLNITNGGTLNVDGNANVGGTLEVTGNTIIGGTLSLPAGIIGNAALANPSAFDVNWADLNSTNLTVAGAYLASMSIPVPSGFTRALVVCNGTVGNTRNVSAGGAPFYVAAIIGATAAATIATTCPDGGSASLTSMWVASLTGLTSGGSISASVWAAVDSTSGWTAGTANAHTVAYATFLR